MTPMDIRYLSGLLDEIHGHFGEIPGIARRFLRLRRFRHFRRGARGRRVAPPSCPGSARVGRAALCHVTCPWHGEFVTKNKGAQESGKFLGSHVKPTGWGPQDS